MQRLPCIYFAPSRLGGRGVFTTEAIPAGTLLEVCPVIVMPPSDLKLVHQTFLHDYYFLWGEEQDHCALALGYGSLYNHSEAPSVECVPDYDSETMDYVAMRDIAAGEELTINYGGDEPELTEIWFDVRV